MIDHPLSFYCNYMMSFIVNSCLTKPLRLAFVLQKLLIDRYAEALLYGLREMECTRSSQQTFSPFYEKRKISGIQSDLTHMECINDREQRWLPS